MSDTESQSQTPSPAAPAAPSPAPQKPAEPTHMAENVIIRPWPKVVFLYPTFVCATIFFLLSWLELVTPTTLGNVFMGVFFLNLLVFSFDFSRIKSITILIAAVAVVLGVLWVDSQWKITDFLGNVADSVDIQMNAAFYGFLSAGLGFLLLLVFINTRFNYYEVNAREVIHHHGYLGDTQRWSTEGLEMNKEIYDIAEYILLRSGRLVFQPMTSKKAIVLDNVPNVTRIEKSTNDLLSHIAVRINQRPGPG